MRVAVIGAGPAGLACALTLERLGIRFEIYEKGDQVGYPVPMVQTLLTISHPRLGDQIAFLRQECGLSIEPLARLVKVVYRCPGVREEIVAEYGYLLLRGRDEGSLERQMAGRLGTRIRLGHWVEAGQLTGYDYVVVADGSGRTARRAGVWQRGMRAQVRGAHILGEFDPGTARIYFDTAYAGHGFGTLLPFDSRRALLALYVPVARGRRMDHRWRLFLAREEIDYDVFTRFDLVYAAGTVLRHQIGRILLAGNAGGLTDPFLGLGLLASMVSGVLAARAVAGEGDYERMLTAYVRRQEEFARVRAAFDAMDQGTVNGLVKALGLPFLRRLVPGGNLDVIGLCQPLLPPTPREQGG